MRNMFSECRRQVRYLGNKKRIYSGHLTYKVEIEREGQKRQDWEEHGIISGQIKV